MTVPLSHLARGRENLDSSQMKRAKLMIDVYRKRNELSLKLKEVNAKQN